MAHGGYVTHGQYSYRVVGDESDGLAHGHLAMHGVRGAPNDMALGPRMGSEVAAPRRDPMVRSHRIRPFP